MQNSLDQQPFRGRMGNLCRRAGCRPVEGATILKAISLRIKIALSAGVLASLVVLVFAVFSAWWFYSEQLDMKSGDERNAASAKQIAESKEETSELMTAYLVALPLAALFSALGAWWLAAKLTAPVVHLTRAAEKIDAQSLDVRLPVPASDDEIASLARTLNRLLDRLERSFRQSTRFSADASHELRTPLAVMRAQLEQAIKDHRLSGQTGIFVELLDENHRISSIADRLLLLAKADAGRLLPSRAEVDLSKLVADVADDYRIMAKDRSVTVEGGVEWGVWVRGDAGLLRQMALNLFDNALKYNVPDGWIRYHLASASSGARLSISNSGSPIPESARSMLFDRFFRLDESRDRNGGGAGLGLSLCREIAHAHGGNIVLARSGSAENEFLLELPSVEPHVNQVENAG
jgi:heavy metal sensor kinase